MYPSCFTIHACLGSISLFAGSFHKYSSYISEKEFFNKLGLNHEALKEFDNYFTSMTDNYSNQIQMSTNFMKAYVKMRISAIQSADRYMHVIMDTNAKMLSQFNSATKK